MIPLVGALNEFRTVKQTIVETADEVIKAAGVELKYTVGTMIEIPRACLIADEIAKEGLKAAKEMMNLNTGDIVTIVGGVPDEAHTNFMKIEQI